MASITASSRSRYANLLRAWKHGLDTDGSGKLGFVEFVNAARKHASAEPTRLHRLAGEWTVGYFHPAH